MLPFDALHLKKQFRYLPKERNSYTVYGYDTETIDGYCRLIADSKGHLCYPVSFDDILHFLCTKDRRGTYGFFFNLKYDFQSLLKWLDAEAWEKIYHTGKLAYTSSDGKRYEIFYIPKKLLKIRQRYAGKKKDSRIYRFFDIAQYFRMSLNEASLKYLGEAKIAHGLDLKNLTIADLKKPIARKYCIDDSKKAARLAEVFIDICSKMDLKPANFCSPASIASHYFLKHADIPTLNTFIEKKSLRPYLAYPWRATRGAFISVFKRGYFENCRVYDINSAYPHATAQLPDIRDGRFYFTRGFKTGAYMAWMRAVVEIHPDDYGFYTPCLPVERRVLSNYYPVGVFETYLTLNEFRYLKQFLNIEILDGLYWVPNMQVRYPFKKLINEKYRERLATDDPQIKYFLKIVLNGFFGKNLEKNRDRDETSNTYGKWLTGNLFNPFYGSYILADSRLAVFARLAKMRPGAVIACFTDSIITTDFLDVPLSDQLGGWALEAVGDAIIIGCGVYEILADSPICKLRGYHPVNFKKKLGDDRCFLKTVIKQNAASTKLPVIIRENYTPLRCIIQKIPEKMNYLVDGDKEIDINFDSKRLWASSFKNAGQLLERQIDSMPIFTTI